MPESRFVSYRVIPSPKNPLRIGSGISPTRKPGSDNIEIRMYGGIPTLVASIQLPTLETKVSLSTVSDPLGAKLR